MRRCTALFLALGGVRSFSERNPHHADEQARLFRVGTFPPELQRYYIFPGAVSTTSRAPDAAMALLRFLKTPAAVRIIRAQGMEPG
jgi:ABC-type molybdate transport system substrate-binding protein